MKFEHNGIAITIDKKGVFHADGRTGHVDATSLIAIKRKLETREQFKPFTALRYGDFFGTEDRVKVVTIVRSRTKRSWGGATLFWVTDEGREHQVVYQDTPANRKLLKAHAKQHAAWRATRYKRDREIEQQLAKVARVDTIPAPSTGDKP